MGLPLSTCQQYIKVMTLPDMKETLLCGASVDLFIFYLFIYYLFICRELEW